MLGWGTDSKLRLPMRFFSLSKEFFGDFSNTEKPSVQCNVLGGSWRYLSIYFSCKLSRQYVAISIFSSLYNSWLSSSFWVLSMSIVGFIFPTHDIVIWNSISSLNLSEIYVISLNICTIFTEKLLVLLRDGRKLLGILRSFDQFGIKFSQYCWTWSWIKVSQ